MLRYRSALCFLLALLLASVQLSSQQLIDRQKAIDAINALPAVAPPAAIKESCNADGTPNGVDEDQDGAVDENCKALPPAPVNCAVSPFAMTAATAWAPAVCPSSGQQSRTETWTRTVTTPPSNGGAPCPPLTELRTGTQACTFVPPATGTYPSGWDDPRFVNMTTRGINSYNMSGVNEGFQITTSSGEPMIGCSNFTARRFRIRGREGVRACSPGNILLEDGYVEATGSGSDHADGFQTYGGSSMPNIVLRRMHIKVSGADNAAFFAADNAGASFLIENSRLDGSNAPNGALFVANVPGDTGCRAMGLRNVELVGHVRFEGTCPITVWENVTLNGKTLNRPW